MHGLSQLSAWLIISRIYRHPLIKRSNEKRVSFAQTDDTLEVHNTIVERYLALERTGYTRVDENKFQTPTATFAKFRLLSQEPQSYYRSGKLYLRPITKSLSLREIDEVSDHVLGLSGSVI